MPEILADVKVERHFNILIAILNSEAWREYWALVDLPALFFADVGLDPSSPDPLVWSACQEKELVLFTANRNAAGPDSLEEVLRTSNRPTHLPLLTLGNPRRFLAEKSYSQSVAEKVIDYLLDLDSFRGAGRLYVP